MALPVILQTIGQLLLGVFKTAGVAFLQSAGTSLADELIGGLHKAEAKTKIFKTRLMRMSS